MGIRPVPGAARSGDLDPPADLDPAARSAAGSYRSLRYKRTPSSPFSGGEGSFADKLRLSSESSRSGCGLSAASPETNAVAATGAGSTLTRQLNVIT